MPTYTYRCKKCNSRFDVSGKYESLIGFTPQCPECKSLNATRIYGDTPVIFKGKGFYTNDRYLKKDHENP